MPLKWKDWERFCGFHGQQRKQMSGFLTNLCDLIWHVSFRSGEASCKLLYSVYLYLTYVIASIFVFIVRSKYLQALVWALPNVQTKGMLAKFVVVVSYSKRKQFSPNIAICINKILSTLKDSNQISPLICLVSCRLHTGAAEFVSRYGFLAIFP